MFKIMTNFHLMTEAGGGKYQNRAETDKFRELHHFTVMQPVRSGKDNNIVIWQCPKIAAIIGKTTIRFPSLSYKYRYASQISVTKTSYKESC